MSETAQPTSFSEAKPSIDQTNNAISLASSVDDIPGQAGRALVGKVTGYGSIMSASYDLINFDTSAPANCKAAAIVGIATGFIGGAASFGALGIWSPVIGVAATAINVAATAYSSANCAPNDPKKGEPPKPPKTPPRDPLILDLDGDGLELTSAASSNVYFDGDGDGVLERTGWAKPDDGFLVIDRNGDGQISSTAEMFGNATEDGFTVLTREDSNADGVINASDASFANLKIWRDLDSDGVTDFGELFALEAAGVSSISLGDEPNYITVAGNTIAFSSTYVDEAGSEQEVSAVFLDTDSFNTQFAPDPDLMYPEDVALLPELKGFGRLNFLSASMAKDPELLDLVKTLTLNSNSMDSIAFRAAFEAILLKWSGSDGINPTARGSLVNAQEINFLEKISGQGIFARNADGTLSQIISTNFQANSLANQFDYWVDHFMLRFGSQIALAQSMLADDPMAFIDSTYGVLALVQYDLTTGAITTDPNFLLHNIPEFAPQGDIRATISYLDQVMPFLGSIAGAAGFSGEFPTVSAQSLATLARDALEELGDSALIEFAIARIDGGSNRLEAGTQGNDQLTANGDTNAVFVGSLGADVLTGSFYSDTYVYAAGDGDDVIEDAGNGSRSDQLLLAGISPADIAISAAGTDLVISINAPASGSIRLVGQLAGSGIEKVVFSDGTVYLARDLATKLLQASATEAADVINGYVFDESLIGLGGDDAINGGFGNDTLAGGVGNDALTGGAGNDTYVYSAGDGDDAIQTGATFEIETLVLRGISPDDVSIGTVVSGGTRQLLVVINGVSPAVLTVNASLDDAILDAIVFDDGTTWTAQIIEQKALVSLATAAADTITGFSGDDIINGGAGDDNLSGRGGSDSYVYKLGDGHDVILETSESGNSDSVVFQNISFADVSFVRSGASNEDLTVVINTPPGGSVRIAGAFSNGFVENLAFSDGTTISPLQAASYLLKSAATAGNDTITGLSSDDIINGLEGDDTITGGGGADQIEGGSGNDSLNGGTGIDTLSGGIGTDTLLGGDTGRDVFQYRRGDGTDTITDARGDEIQLLDFNRSDVTLERATNGVDLVIRVAGATEDVITVVGQWTTTSNPLIQIRFEDGTVLAASDIRRELLASLATASNDTIAGFTTHDDVFGGGLGDDRLEGGRGIDTYIYNRGDGNDVIADGGIAEADILQLNGVSLADATITE